MPGRLRCRKRKSSSKPSGSGKACPSQSQCVSSEGKVCVGSSGISCECEQWSAQRRCSASPQPPPRRDKENQQEAPCCGESMDFQDDGKTLFPDDDSNQVLPVEQFFGNMDTVQDFPQRTSAPSTSVQRAQRRRRYFAPEDSDDCEDPDGEGVHSRTSQDTVDCPSEEDCPMQRH